MAEHPNLELARKGYEAFGKGDMETVGELMDDGIVWHVSGDTPLSGDYKGKEAVMGYFARLMQETGGTLKNDVHDMLANDEHGVALVNLSATRGDKSLEMPSAQVFHMKDGKMTEFWAFSQDSAAFDDFWA